MTDNRATELVPCPFCGGEAETWDGAGPWHVVCTECGTIGSPCLSEAEAITAWNSRADYHGFEQAAIEAWESVKAWNSRAERTCKNVDDHKTVWFICSVCGYQQKLSHTKSYCPNCGARVVE